MTLRRAGWLASLVLLLAAVAPASGQSLRVSFDAGVKADRAGGRAERAGREAGTLPAPLFGERSAPAPQEHRARRSVPLRPVLGRAFVPSDASPPRVALVNVSLARQLFGTDDVVGRQLRFGSMRGAPSPVRRDRHRAVTPTEPNALWCADYKGEFMLGDKRYCYPLTVTDHASRYLLLCEALESTAAAFAFTAFEHLFRERGLPRGIRSDNGAPFASPNGLFNLSKLSVWWLRLGIAIERIKPGHPQQNGRHQRMHLTLKKEATRPPGTNSLQQQGRFDAFVHEFNAERPHEALAMKCPAELYVASPRRYGGLPELTARMIALHEGRTNARA